MLVGRLLPLLWLLLAHPALAQGNRVPPPLFSASQETILLSASKMVAAAERCEGVKVNDAKLTVMLRDAGIAEDDMYLKQRSPSLKAEVQRYVDSFKGRKDQACAMALAEGRQSGLLDSTE